MGKAWKAWGMHILLKSLKLKNMGKHVKAWESMDKHGNNTILLNLKASEKQGKAWGPPSRR